ncbi:hypothetical protein GJAV_G00000770 [Gymnothorax javanicus]|nr:hypothetical protein GJAV_G00000770 [Gymnothorax javanicus]
MLGFSPDASQLACCWETEHYFYDGDDAEEDFHKSTAPSEDIWKKFKLVATPPPSPARTADGCAISYPSPGDTLEWMSQFLGQDEQSPGPCKIDTADIFGNLSSIINQDCMWGGFSARERQCGSAQMKAPLSTQTGAQSQDSTSLGTLLADCVDPAAVLPYPYSHGISRKKQASSGSELHTDSSDDEEIDVVTVEGKQKNGRSSSLAIGGGRMPVTITVRADPHDPEMKLFHVSVHQQQHNYAAPSPASETEADHPQPLPPPTKRVKQEPGYPLQCLGPAPSPSERTAPIFNPAPFGLTDSSDSEDSDRRKAHNILERKRRSDLRSRFLALRDQIPGLASGAKTAKVVILTRATELLQQLQATERRDAQERRRLRARQKQLLGRLSKLKCQN